MLAAGTGITPFIPILQQSLNDPEDETEFILVYGNRYLKDIMLKNHLDSMCNIQRLKIIYTLSGENQKGYMFGRIDGSLLDDIQATLPQFIISGETIVLICGQTEMMEVCVNKVCEMGMTRDCCFVF
jgi:NAD(P)H-flavin reductase